MSVPGVDGVLAEVIQRDIIAKDLGVTFDDIAALDEAKRLLNEAVVLPLLVSSQRRAPPRQHRKCSSQCAFREAPTAPPLLVCAGMLAAAAPLPHSTCSRMRSFSIRSKRCYRWFGLNRCHRGQLTLVQRLEQKGAISE